MTHPENKYYDAFISYRRSSSSHLAQLLHSKLAQKPYDFFLDINDLPSGQFADYFLTLISNTPNIILLLSHGCLDRCADSDDWFGKEIHYAILKARNIIPVVDEGFQFPCTPNLQEISRQILSYNHLAYTHQYADAVVDGICKRLAIITEDRILGSWYRSNGGTSLTMTFKDDGGLSIAFQFNDEARQKMTFWESAAFGVIGNKMNGSWQWRHGRLRIDIDSLPDSWLGSTVGRMMVAMVDKNLASLE